MKLISGVTSLLALASTASAWGPFGNKNNDNKSKDAVDQMSFAENIYNKICAKDVCLHSYCPEGIDKDTAIVIVSESNQENVQYYFNAVQEFRNRVCDAIVEHKSSMDAIAELIEMGIEDPIGELKKYGACEFDDLHCITAFLEGHIGNLEYALTISPYTVVSVNTTTTFEKEDDETSTKESRRKLFAPAASMTGISTKPIIIGSKAAKMRAGKIMTPGVNRQIVRSMSSDKFSDMSQKVSSQTNGQVQPLSKYSNGKLSMTSKFGRGKALQASAMESMVDTFSGLVEPYPLSDFESFRLYVLGQFDNSHQINGLLTESIYGKSDVKTPPPYAKKFVDDITHNVLVGDNDEKVKSKNVFFTHEVLCFNKKEMDLQNEYGFSLTPETPCIRSIVQYRSDGENEATVQKFHVPAGYTADALIKADKLVPKANFKSVKQISYNKDRFFMHSRVSTVDSTWQIEEVITPGGLVTYRQTASKKPTEDMNTETIRQLPSSEVFAEFFPIVANLPKNFEIEKELKFPSVLSEADMLIDPPSPESAIFMNKASEDVADRPRKFAIGGNWKANGNVESVKKLVNILNSGSKADNVDVLVFPPAIFLGYVKDNLNDNYHVGAQNVAKDCYGAYTGEVCAAMLKDFGIDWTIIGHSERREGFGHEGESNELVAEKTKTAIDNGLQVVPCVGEKLEDREDGKTMDVIIEQLKPIVEALDEEDWEKVILAYEPVWAIGTGKVATPEQAQEVHQDIRKWIAENVSEDVALKLRIQYGGSVKGESAAGLIEKPDIDGFLVGGASLTDDFLTIINAADTYEK